MGNLFSFCSPLNKRLLSFIHYSVGWGFVGGTKRTTNSGVLQRERANGSQNLNETTKGCGNSTEPPEVGAITFRINKMFLGKGRGKGKSGCK